VSRAHPARSIELGEWVRVRGIGEETAMENYVGIDVPLESVIGKCWPIDDECGAAA
jgi:hypothetical protein